MFNQVTLPPGLNHELLRYPPTLLQLVQSALIEESGARGCGDAHYVISLVYLVEGRMQMTLLDDVAWELMSPF